MAQYFAALLALCLSVGSLGTTPKPQQQNTSASKDLCEVSTKELVHFTGAPDIFFCCNICSEDLSRRQKCYEKLRSPRTFLTNWFILLRRERKSDVVLSMKRVLASIFCFQSTEEEGEPSKRLDLQNLTAYILNKTFIV